MNSDPARRWAKPIDEARMLLRGAALSHWPAELDPEDDADDIAELRVLINRTRAAAEALDVRITQTRRKED